MVAQLGDKIREFRTKQNLVLRQVVSKLDVDTSIISKMERAWKYTSKIKRQVKKEVEPIQPKIIISETFI